MKMVCEQDEQKCEAKQKRLSWKMQGAWQFGSPKSDIKALENGHFLVLVEIWSPNKFESDLLETVYKIALERVLQVHMTVSCQLAKTTAVF